MNEAQELSKETSGQAERRRLVRLLAFFLPLAVIVVGLPLAVGIVRARRQAAEDRIVRQLKAYCQAQYAFHRESRTGSGKLDYVRDYRTLVGFQDAPEDSRKLLDAAFAAARGPDGAPKHGYLYREMRSIMGLPINWQGDFAICAIPAKYGETGRKTFIMKTDGDVWSRDPGKAEFLEDFPSDPAKAGWQTAR